MLSISGNGMACQQHTKKQNVHTNIVGKGKGIDMQWYTEILIHVAADDVYWCSESNEKREKGKKDSQQQQQQQ